MKCVEWGATLGIDPGVRKTHPFPGPGLSIRILGDITPESTNLTDETWFL
jgi:GMP synthase (glutamine-hydrolysing)